MGLPIFENSRPTNIKDDVQQAASRLESTSGADFRDALDQIKGRLNCKGSDYADKFLPALDAQLQADGMKSQVLQSFAQADFNALSHGNKRISDRDLAGAQIEFHNNGRALEEHFTQQMADSQADIEHAKREHKFLFFGHKSGIDDKRLTKYGDQEVEHNQSGNMLNQYGPNAGFQSLARHQSTSNGEVYITKDDIKNAIAANDVSYSKGQGNQLSSDQLAALIYMEKNFNKLSTSVPDGKDVNDQQEYRSGITVDSMLKFAAKRGTTPESLEQEAQFRQQNESNLNSLTSDYQAIEKSNPRGRRDCDNDQVTETQPVVKEQPKADPDANAARDKEIADKYAKLNDHLVVDTPVRDNWTRIALQALRLDPASSCYNGGNCDIDELNGKIDNLRQINGYADKKGSYYGLPRRDLIRAGKHVHLWNADDLNRITSTEQDKARAAQQTDKDND